jgi:hypothetical protein
MRSVQPTQVAETDKSPGSSGSQRIGRAQACPALTPRDSDRIEMRGARQNLGSGVAVMSSMGTGTSTWQRPSPGDGNTATATGDGASAVAQFGHENTATATGYQRAALASSGASNSATVNGDYNDAYAYRGDGKTATVTGEWGCAGPPGPTAFSDGNAIMSVTMVASENTLGRG